MPKSKIKPTVSLNGVAKVPSKKRGRKPAKDVVQPIQDLPAPDYPLYDDELGRLCLQLRGLQRKRAELMKSRVMITNRIVSVVASRAGYAANQTDEERKARFEAAAQTVKDVCENDAPHEYANIIKSHMRCADEFDVHQTAVEKEMVKIVRQLPVYDWINHRDRNGFGEVSLAVVVGETGDLRQYPNPAKVWRRMGCAPWTYRDETKMGSTWRMQGGLPKDEWSKFGYSPRRRSIMYVIGENLVKQNGAGPYRRRWLEAKVRAVETRPEWPWKPCDKCKADPGADCGTCGNTRVKCLPGHRHGMLCAVKLLLKHLWMEWNKDCMEGRSKPWAG